VNKLTKFDNTYAQLLSVPNHYYALIANGDFPKNTFLRDLIVKADQIICCDGAVNQLSLLITEAKPNYIIGDGDSISREHILAYQDRVLIISEQNTNDLTKAIHFIHTQLPLLPIFIFGATGLREDHTIANISLLSQYAHQKEVLTMISDYGIFTAHDQSAVIQTISGQFISFFTTNPNTIINCDQLKYPLFNKQFLNWHEGTLNQATGAQIILKSSGQVIVYRSFELKKRSEIHV